MWLLLASSLHGCCQEFPASLGPSKAKIRAPTIFVPRLLDDPAILTSSHDIMKPRFLLASAVLMMACLARAAPSTLNPGIFNQVRVCVPYAIKVAPGAAYSVQIDAEKAVQDAFRASVTSGTLKLASIGDFSTQQPIKVIVTLPAEALRSVASVGDVVLAPGFTPQQLTLSSVGSGSLVVKGLMAPDLSVSTSG